MVDCSYKLKIEWANLETYFTHLEDDIVTEWYGYEAFYNFLNVTEYPFSLKEVEYIDKNINTNVNSIILNYHMQYKTQNCNFLASDKYSNKLIFLRSYDLALFPRYFENWIIHEIYYCSTPHHILEYSYIKKELEYMTNHSQYFTFLPLSKMMYLSLCLEEVTEDNFNSELVQSILVGFERIFKNKKTVFEIKHSFQSKPSWSRFCKSVRSSFVQSELDNISDGLDINTTTSTYKNMNSIETILEANLGLMDKLKHAMFFNDFLKTDQTEITLLSTLPISLENKNSTLIVK